MDRRSKVGSGEMEQALCLEKIVPSKSIRSGCSKNYAIFPRQKPTLLFYHIILQHPIYQMFYNSILYIKIIFTTH